MDTTPDLRPPLAPQRAEVSDTALRLAAHATLARELPAGACVAVQSGRVWLTQTGDATTTSWRPGSGTSWPAADAW